MSDSLMLVRVEGNTLDTIRAPKPGIGRMTFHSGFPLLDFLYRLEASAPFSGRYTALTPYEIFLNPLQNDSAIVLLEGRLKNGLVVPYGTRSLGWPAINSNAEWLLAATELDAAMGDRRWNRTVDHAASQMLAYDREICRNPSTGLFTGVPRYMASTSGLFPRWMGANDIAGLSTLAVNVAYCAAFQRLGIPADTLLHSIKREMWLPESGYMSALCHGIPSCPIAIRATDNLAQAIAIISGTISGAMADAIVRKTPVQLTGASLYEPDLPSAGGNSREGIPPLLLQAAWTAATARTGNEAAYSTATGSLLALEGRRLLGYRYQPAPFRSTFATLILRCFLGLQFSQDGLSFSPYVPENLPGEKTIANLRYRGATIDIRITGTGHAIASFTIDGKPSEPFFPADLTGSHNIQITLAGASYDPGAVNIQEATPVAPPPPVTEWTANCLAKLSPGNVPAPPPVSTDTKPSTDDDSENKENDIRYIVYVNGIEQETIQDDSHQLSETTFPAVIQFASIDIDNCSGFSSKPHICLPARSQTTLYAADIARGGTKILKDKQLAARFVETNRFKNRNIPFSFDAPADGKYLVEIHYVNGLGIVNSQRRLALRRLRANSREAGTFLFPQLAPSSVSKNAGGSWQEMTDWSNPLIVSLRKGLNLMELRYYQPSPVYTDPNSNVILIDMIRITPI